MAAMLGRQWLMVPAFAGKDESSLRCHALLALTTIQVAATMTMMAPAQS
jgi:hypothetical protein